jgi:site-specific recombinase XerD
MWIENLPNGKFKYSERYKDAYGRSKRVSVTLDKQTAQAKNEAMRLLNDKIQAKLQTRDTTDVKFWDVLSAWQDDAAYTYKSNTIRAMENAAKNLKRYITDDALLSEVTAPVIHDILTDTYYKRNLSYTLMAHTKTLLSNVFVFSKNKGYMTDNPAREVIIKKKLETLEDREKKRGKYLEQDELREVIALAKAINPRYANLIEFLSLTGLRIGEAFGLQIKNVSDTQVVVNGTFERITKVKSTPKNHYSERVVTLPADAYQALTNTIRDNIVTNRNTGQPDDYIFVNPHGVPLTDTTFNQFLKKLGYSKHLTSHIFRHTHIAMLTELGVPIKAIMDRVGHNEPKTTLAVYSHVTEKISANVVDKLNTIEL